MLEWLSANLGTVIVGTILFVILAAIVIKMVKDKKKGKTSCGCGCANCAMRGSCHKT